MNENPKPKYTEFLRKNLPAISELPARHYEPIPSETGSFPSEKRPVWRVLFEFAGEPKQYLGLDINGEIELGRGINGANAVDLTPFEAETRGVSRRHVALRPTPNNLYVLDLGSTNGTLRNDRTIGVNTPYALSDGDRLILGHLDVLVRIVERPYLQTAPLKKKLDLVEALAQIASAITSQLTLEDVLVQVSSMAMSLTSAGEISIWLVDENSGELYLEAQLGIDDDRLRRTRMVIREDTPAGKVIRTGKPLRTNHKPGEDLPQLMTGYLVEALAHVPISLGGVTIGVLSAAHTVPGQLFEDRDEDLLQAIAKFAAIAIQNARMYEATDEALALRLDDLAALNEVSRAVSASLDLVEMYDVLVQQIVRNVPVEMVQIYLLVENQRLQPLQTSTKSLSYALNGIIGQTIKENKVIVANDAASHPAYNPATDNVNGRSPQSLACFPLIVHDHTVGVLALLNKVDGPFTDNDIKRLTSFSYPVATAIENARLFADSERQRAAIQATAYTLTEPLIVIDTNGHVLLANTAAEYLLNHYMSEMFTAISNGVGKTTEVTIGNKVYLSSSQHVADVGTIVIMQDITYVKQLEKDRSEVMHMLSHDMKNPLMAIMGWSALLERIVPANEQTSRFLHEIEVATDRMLEMVNQLLETVRQSEHVELVRSSCDLDEIVAKVVRDMGGVAVQKEMIVQSQTEGTPQLIQGDAVRLYHMILNLVDNAMKYAPPKTQVDINLRYLREGIQIIVRDEGPGIPEQDLPRVFDRYYRGVQGTINKAAGSGVGLAAVKHMAEAHGGSVQVRNGAEKGAVFTITLPASLREA
jgi:K+-sensing histidine kinase KdpD